MNGKRLLAGLAACAALILAAGCEETHVRKPPQWTNPLDAMEQALVADPEDTNYMLCRMEFGRQAIRFGSYLRAKPRLREAFEQLESDRDNVAAALGTEQLKYYKGETYERAMLCFYLGLAEYLSGDYNNARIFFSRALSADRQAVVNKSTPEIYGEDFGLAFYWLGKTYHELGDDGNSAIAFKKANVETPRKETQGELKEDRKEAEQHQKHRLEAEEWTHKKFQNEKKPEHFVEDAVNLAEVQGKLEDSPGRLAFASPESPLVRSTQDRSAFFTLDYQKQCNLLLTIEVGRCPMKHLSGLHAERAELKRTRIRPCHVKVFVDGHYAGRAFEILDMWEQAATQDRIAEKDAAQTTKAILKEIFSHAPYAGSLAGHWDVTGDFRHWYSLPGRLYQFAARLSPGRHTVRLDMYDANGNLLPRWTNTYYGVGVPREGEACVLLNPHYDADNALPAEQRQRAIAAGAQPYLPGM